MTNIEAKDLLKKRVEWETPLNSDFSYLNFSNSESGRYLQEEHSSVRISIIHDLVADIDITENDFKIYLLKFKDSSIIQMLHDVFSDVKEIKEMQITNNIHLFDYAIILKLTINNISNLINSTRINMQETITKENLNRFYIDLNGIKDRENGIFVSGFVERYRREVNRIKQVLFMRRRRLKVITAR